MRDRIRDVMLALLISVPVVFISGYSWGWTETHEAIWGTLSRRQLVELPFGHRATILSTDMDAAEFKRIVTLGLVTDRNNRRRDAPGAEHDE